MAADPSSAETIRQAARLDRLLTAADLGVTPEALSRAEKSGVVVRVAPGVYLGAGHQRGRLTQGAAWTLRHPNAVVGLLTAAVFHDLTDAFPRGTWMLVPIGGSVPRSAANPLQVVQVAPWSIDPADDADLGIVTVHLHGVSVRMTGPARTVVDIWRFPRRVSVEHALTALRRYSKVDDFQVPDLARLARRFGAWGSMGPVVRGLLLR